MVTQLWTRARFGGFHPSSSPFKWKNLTQILSKLGVSASALARWLANNGFICGVWHQPGWTLYTHQMVQKIISTYLVFLHGYEIMTQTLCFVVTCIPVKVIFKKQSLELIPLQVNWLVTLEIWAHEHEATEGCLNAEIDPILQRLSLKCKGKLMQSGG